MGGVRSRYQVRVTPKGIVFETSPWRRIIFGLIAVVMIAAGFFGTDPLFTMDNPVSLVVYLILCIACLSVVLYRDVFLFPSEGLAIRKRTLLGIRFFPVLEVPVADLGRIFLDRLVIRQGDTRQLKSGMNFLPPRKTKYFFKLLLETETDSWLLEDAAQIDSLEKAGRLLADYLDIPFETSEE